MTPSAPKKLIFIKKTYRFPSKEAIFFHIMTRRRSASFFGAAEKGKIRCTHSRWGERSLLALCSRVFCFCAPRKFGGEFIATAVLHHKTHPEIYLFADGKSPTKYHPYFSGVLLSRWLPKSSSRQSALRLYQSDPGAWLLPQLKCAELWSLSLERDHFQFLHFVSSTTLKQKEPSFPNK